MCKHSEEIGPELLERGIPTVQRQVSNRNCWVLQFADLRQKHCILAGGSGTYSNLIAHNDIPFSTYHNCLIQIICTPPQTRRNLGTCNFCRIITTLRDDKLVAMDDNMTDSIVFKQFVSVDKCTLETVT